MSFYRAYRPQQLADLIGQEHIRRTFLNAIKKGMLSHAYLFTGPRGTGKTSTARIIARAINCETPQADGEPCNMCDVCTAAISGRLVDLIEIDAASNRGIDEMRDLKEKIAFAPNRARAKVYIIDEVHMLTKEAFNALLKTLEEPPSHAFFILATTEIHKVPDTIISRCQRFDFHRVSVDDLAAHLATVAMRESIDADADALTLIARQSAGGVRDALGLLEQLGSSGLITAVSVAASLGLTRPATIDDFVHALLFGQIENALGVIDGLVGDGASLIQFNKAVIARLRELMLEKVSERKLGEAKGLLDVIAAFTTAGEELKYAIIPQLPLEVASIAVCAKDVVIAPVTSGVSGEGREMKDEKKLIPPETGVARDERGVAPMANDNSQTPNVVSKIDVTPNAPTAPVNTPTPTKKELSLEVVAAAFDSAVGLIKKAAVKLSLKECGVTRVDGTTIVIGAPTDFTLGRLDTPDTQHIVAEAFTAMLGVSVAIRFERAEIELRSAARVADIVPSAPVKVDLAKAAEALFGDDETF